MIGVNGVKKIVRKWFYILGILAVLFGALIFLIIIFQIVMGGDTEYPPAAMALSALMVCMGLTLIFLLREKNGSDHAQKSRTPNN